MLGQPTIDGHDLHSISKAHLKKSSDGPGCRTRKPNSLLSTPPWACGLWMSGRSNGTVVAGVDDQDVALADIGHTLDHLRRVEAVVGDGRRCRRLRRRPSGRQRHVGRGRPAGVEGALAGEVRAGVVAPTDELAVGTLAAAEGAGHTFEKGDFQRLLSRPRRREDTRPWLR